MNFINKLNDTFDLLYKLDEIVIKDMDSGLAKKQLLLVSEDLARYKDLDDKNTKFESDEIKLKINQILKRINEIDINIKNKLLLIDKYNIYLNS